MSVRDRMTANQQKVFALGYQEALADIAAALERDGWEGVSQWLRDNKQD